MCLQHCVNYQAPEEELPLPLKQKSILHVAQQKLTSLKTPKHIN